MDETRNRIRWTIRINPTRKKPDGEMLEACYSCHKASAKPYLRPMIPTTPPQTIINYDPNAKWPL